MEATANLTPEQPKKSNKFASFTVIMLIVALLYCIYTQRCQKDSAPVAKVDSVVVEKPKVDSSANVMDTTTKVK